MSKIKQIPILSITQAVRIGNGIGIQTRDQYYSRRIHFSSGTHFIGIINYVKIGNNLLRKSKPNQDPNNCM